MDKGKQVRKGTWSYINQGCKSMAEILPLTLITIENHFCLKHGSGVVWCGVFLEEPPAAI
jgi:hypothetical protein